MTLANPASIATADGSVNIYNAPDDTTLSRGTTYWLVTSNSAETDGEGFRVKTVTSSTADNRRSSGMEHRHRAFDGCHQYQLELHQ